MSDEAPERPDSPGDEIADVTRHVSIVGIGASAGGVKALREFFGALPANPGAAFVVIVHLDPNVRSELAEILSSHSKMPVHQITKKT